MHVTISYIFDLLVSITIRISLSVRKLRDGQIKHDQTRLQYDEFLKSLAYNISSVEFWVH